MPHHPAHFIGDHARQARHAQLKRCRAGRRKRGIRGRKGGYFITLILHQNRLNRPAGDARRTASRVCGTTGTTTDKFSIPRATRAMVCSNTGANFRISLMRLPGKTHKSFSPGILYFARKSAPAHNSETGQQSDGQQNDRAAGKCLKIWLSNGNSDKTASKCCAILRARPRARPKPRVLHSR
ncbi:MAG: hypothetical protein CM15mP21_3550 [Hyphomicrobiales bacterium]|nr:MAG: hypothetical protein CM15mP21_3550 [Hyphomicrobiales bacterium]